MKLSYLADSATLSVTEGFTEEYKALVRQANGNLVRVTVETITERTKGMNAKFHAMCRQLAKEAGDGTENTVNAIKEMAKSIATEYYGYPQLTDDDGRLLYDVEGRPRGMSTADATASEFTLLLDALRTLADTYGYELEGKNV